MSRRRSPLPPLLASLLMLASCAKRGTLPPGDDLESSNEGDFRPLSPASAPSDEAALSQAFDAPAPVSAPAPPPRPAEHLPVVTADDEALAALALAKRQLRERDLEGAKVSLERAEGAVTPAAQQLHAELEVQLAVAGKDKRAAREAAERWMERCGPEKTDTCRAKAQRAWAQAQPKDERLTRIREADACLQKVEALLRGPGPVALPPCLDPAGSLYRRMKDVLMDARVKLARGLAAARETGRSAQAVGYLEAAERSCDGARCVELRRRALRHLSRIHAEAKRPVEAAKAALREMELASRSLPPEEQLYARTPEVEKRCAALDELEGPGTCRKLERSMLGRYSFRDYSRERSKGELDPERVREVNAHFHVMVEECLQAQAAKLRPPASETYEVRWSVLNDGRVDGVKMGRVDQENGEVARCLREQFSKWRYPPYQGEQQHVEQRFVVHARERR